ncbi:MAG: isochorismatase family protein, partial [Ginsengibacter sp.]
IKPMKTCLIIVDVQNDFCPGGVLAAKTANEIIPVINELMEHFSLIVASKDWHPAKSIHFEKWPVHCVRATAGAAFHPDLNIEKINELFLKGIGNYDDGYSAFESTNMDLNYWLQKHDVDTVYICGIATEYCVFQTAIHALQFGFKVKVIKDAVAEIEVAEGDTARAFQEMEKAGIRLLSSQEFMAEKQVFQV